MHIDDSGNLSLHAADLLPYVRKYKSPLTVKLLPCNFTREACIAAWYAQQCGYRISFVTPGRLEHFDVEQVAWSYLRPPITRPCRNCTQPVALRFDEGLGYYRATCPCGAACGAVLDEKINIPDPFADRERFDAAAQVSSTTGAATGALLTKEERGHLVRLCAELEAREEAALRSQEGPEAQTRAFERVALRKLMGLPADGAPRSEVDPEVLTLRPGSFYESRAGDVWCCYCIDNKEPAQARARCVMVASGCAAYFFEDGRYDEGGQREHTLIRAVRPPETVPFPKPLRGCR